jgi:hypothetical protein
LLIPVEIHRYVRAEISDRFRGFYYGKGITGSRPDNTCVIVSSQGGAIGVYACNFCFCDVYVEIVSCKEGVGLFVHLAQDFKVIRENSRVITVAPGRDC